MGFIKNRSNALKSQKLQKMQHIVNYEQYEIDYYKAQGKINEESDKKSLPEKIKDIADTILP